MEKSLKIYLLQKRKQVTMIKTKESLTAMKRYFFLILAVLLSTVVLLTACQPNGSEEQAPTISSYEGYSNIPDLGSIAGAESNAKLAAAAAERMSVDPETVFVYSLGDLPEDALNVWTRELKARGFEKNGTLEEAGNTISWYSEDRDIGVVAGYMDTDKQDGMDAFAVFLANKSLSGKYVDIDYEKVQEAWSNANNGASFFIDDKKIFGYGYIGSADDGFLSKNTDSSSALMLVEGVRPRYVHEWDKTVYACLPDRLVAVDTKKKDPEEVKSMFRSLYDESKDLVERVADFKRRSDALLEAYREYDSQQHYQRENAIMTYLWLQYPDKYYIYKYTEVSTTAKAFETNYTFKKGAYSDNIVAKKNAVCNGRRNVSNHCSDDAVLEIANFVAFTVNIIDVTVVERSRTFP